MEGIGKIQFSFTSGTLEVSGHVICNVLCRKFELCMQNAGLCHFAIGTNVNWRQKVLMAMQISFISPQKKAQDLYIISYGYISKFDIKNLLSPALSTQRWHFCLNYGLSCQCMQRLLIATRYIWKYCGISEKKLGSMLEKNLVGKNCKDNQMGVTSTL